MPALWFVKMHGAGNDYIFFDCFSQKIEKPESLSIAISDRHFGVGSDGIVLIEPSDRADCRMRMFNADGSEGRMCGNAIRCVGKYFYENLSNAKQTIKVETLSGQKTLYLDTNNGEVESIAVDMGKADFLTENIPTIFSKNEFIAERLQVLDEDFIATAVSMGNPHLVIEVQDVEKFEVEKYGKIIERLNIFPDRINTEFAKVVSPSEIEMRVWERGSGETMACGTGACASVAALTRIGKLPIEKEIKVRLKGGELFIFISEDYSVSMRGAATEVFRGEWNK